MDEDEILTRRFLDDENVADAFPWFLDEPLGEVYPA
jgi:hypothetical protein